MSSRIELATPFAVGSDVRRLGVYLGSFDPPHRGHEWIVQELLARCDAVLLLVPARHFDKAVRRGRNATHAERLRLLVPLCARHGGRVGAGIAREVLFLELERLLGARYPGVEVVFGMGDDTFSRLADSPRYYARLGRPFGPAEARALARLLPRVVVFGRSRQTRRMRPVPSRLRSVSSTLVRAQVRQLRARGADAATWRSALRPLVSAGVLALIRELGLYPAGPPEAGPAAPAPPGVARA